MCAHPLASSHSIVWSVSFSVSWSPSPSFWFWLTLWGWTHTSRVLYMFEVLCSGAGSQFSDYSRPLYNHLTAVESKGSGCPDARVDCLLLQGWCESVSLPFSAWRTEERLFRSIFSSSLPRTRRRRAEIHLYLPEWFFQSAGWRSNNLPKSAESLTQKVLEPTKKGGKFRNYHTIYEIHKEMSYFLIFCITGIG